MGVAAPFATATDLPTKAGVLPSRDMLLVQWHGRAIRNGVVRTQAKAVLIDKEARA
jgi:hypothetical protein